MTADHPVQTSPSPEDAGADTSDKFEWQAAVAAADGLALAASYIQKRRPGIEPDNSSVICEHHEDYVVLSHGVSELVSVKHRDLAPGSWTWATLADDGGLAHLFNRWKELGESCRTRLVTNAALGYGEPVDLGRLCLSLRDSSADPIPELKREALIKSFGVEMIHHGKISGIPSEWRVDEKTPKKQIRPPGELLRQVERFLTTLTFDEGRPHRDHIADASPAMYVEPLLELLKVPVSAMRACWLAVLSVFDRRMKARGKFPMGELARLIALHQGENRSQALARSLKPRTITVTDILIAIEMAAMNPGAYEDAHLSATPLTRLSLKLEDGGLTATTVSAAEALADHWRRTRHQHVADVPGIAAEFAVAELELLQLASDAAEAVSSENKYGPLMWKELRRTVGADAVGGLPVKASAGLAMGGVCDLVSQCRIWFGPRFDVLARQAELRQQLESVRVAS